MRTNASPSVLPATDPAVDRGARINALDVVRGFALCGILVVNIPAIASTDGDTLTGPAEPSGDWLGLFTIHRFFPIFSLLFGIGFALQMRSARGRVSRPRLVLLRRLLVLLGIGALHSLLWPGDILTVYAAIGLVVLLPSTWLPRWSLGGLAAVLVAVSMVLGGDRLTLVAGLFLLGAALVRYGVVDRVEEIVWVPLVLFLGLAMGVVAVPLVWFQATAVMGDLQHGRVINTAGLLLAGTYVCVMLVLLCTPLRLVLEAVFAPLGRMALTNYLTATVVVLAIGVGVDASPRDWSSRTVLLVAAGIVSVQWLWSVLWLRWFRFGPVEWLWRWATWGHRPALR